MNLAKNSPEYEFRQQAAEKIRDCYISQSKELDLSDIPITSLAGVILPDHLEDLNLSYTQLSSLKGVRLPNGLVSLNLEDTPLRTLTNIRFRKGLKNLTLSGTKIKTLRNISLPDGLEVLSLKSLDIVDLKGVRLPNSLVLLNLEGTPLRTLINIPLPKGLKSLTLSGTKIRTLRNISLPDGLEELHLIGSDIVDLKRVRLPRSLKVLTLANTCIETLSGVEFPTSLRVLDLLNCIDLTSLPLSLAAFPRSLRINSEGCSLTEEENLQFQRAIDEARTRDSNLGPQWETTIYEAELSNAFSLKELLDEYLHLVRTAYNNPEKELPSLNLSKEEEDLLREFLIGLQEIWDFRKKLETRRIVVYTLYEILTAVASSDEFKEEFFALIHEALGTCGDRVAVTLNRMDIQRRIKTCMDSAGVVKLLIGCKRIELLYEKAQEFTSERNLGDRIEVILYLQIILRTKLDLPIVTQGMLYPDMACTPPGDKIAEDILNETKFFKQILDILTNQEHGVSAVNPFSLPIRNIWVGYLRRTYSTRFEEIEPGDDEIQDPEYVQRWEERRRDLERSLTTEILKAYGYDL